MSEPQRAGPRPSRLTTSGYGFEKAASLPGERLPWKRVEQLLSEARAYWVSTVRRDGRPHTVPVWGVWLDKGLYFETGRQSRKARNLAANPEFAVHVEGADGEAVILEGRANAIARPSLPARFVETYNAKYDWHIEEYLTKPASVVYGLRPRVAFSFTEDLAETATRWLFSER